MSFTTGIYTSSEKSRDHDGTEVFFSTSFFPVNEVSAVVFVTAAQSVAKSELRGFFFLMGGGGR